MILSSSGVLSSRSSTRSPPSASSASLAERSSRPSSKSRCVPSLAVSMLKTWVCGGMRLLLTRWPLHERHVRGHAEHWP